MQGVVMVPSSQRDIFWLDHNFAMYHSTWNAIFGVAPGVAVVDFWGGAFTSPPAAVLVGLNRIDVFGLGKDYAVRHGSYDSLIHSWSGWENLGGNFTSTPVAASTGSNRIDLFGLGVDQGMLHRAWNGSSWTDWEELGGAFTSLPAIWPGGSGIDIFARGLDYMVYHQSWLPGTAGEWRLLGGPLLGAPVAASAPAAIRDPQSQILGADRKFVFVTGADGAIWYITFDGQVWKPWASLGYASKATPGSQDPESFISEPVLTSPPDFDGSKHFVDVFALSRSGASRGALAHGWLDSTGWHGQTDSDGNETGNWIGISRSVGCACAPSIVAGNVNSFQFVFPDYLTGVVGHTEGKMGLLYDNGNDVWDGWIGPDCRLPSFYTFSVDRADIQNTRALSADTDHAAATLAVGRWPVQQVQVEMGDVSVGPSYPFDNLRFEYIVVELCEPVAFAYSIVNSGNQDIAKAIIAGILKAGEDRITDFIKSKINPPNTVTALVVPSQSHGLMADVLTDVGGGIAGGIVGGVAGAALTVVLQQLIALAFADCDGIVASNLMPYQKGRDLQAAIQSNPQGVIAASTPFAGSDSPAGCGANSSYTVYWSISPSVIAGPH